MTTISLSAKLFIGLELLSSPLASQAHAKGAVQRPGSSTKAGRVWGASTNGVTGWIHAQGGDEPFVYVGVQVPPDANTSLAAAGKTNELPSWAADKTSQYFMWTNPFCGPMELRDGHGRIVLPLKQEMNVPDVFPSQFDLVLVKSNLWFQHMRTGFYSGPTLPSKVRVPWMQLSCFRLKDCFKLQAPGEYRLTVWPKIYKRVSPASRVCRRIDVPPVTVTIEFGGKPDD